MKESRRELAERIAGPVPNDGVCQPIPGLYLTRNSQPGRRVHGVTVPSFCVIAQGAKEIYLGESCYRYDTDHYLLATVELPTVGRIVEASEEQPYLGLRLELDP